MSIGEQQPGNSNAHSLDIVTTTTRHFRSSTQASCQGPIPEIMSKACPGQGDGQTKMELHLGCLVIQSRPWKTERRLTTDPFLCDGPPVDEGRINSSAKNSQYPRIGNRHTASAIDAQRRILAEEMLTQPRGNPP